MASGRSHSVASLAAATCFVVEAVTQGSPALFWTAAGALAGTVLNPDLDSDGATIADFFIYSIPRVGIILGKVWSAYSWLYGWLFAHRSFWSHFPIISTMIRVAYFLWPLYYFGFYPPPAFLNGLVAADLIHFCMDQRLFRRIFVQ